MTKEYLYANSVLKVTASEIDVSTDLVSSSNKTISELLHEEKEERVEEKNEAQE